jgi:hypothetical protein
VAILPAESVEKADEGQAGHGSLVMIRSIRRLAACSKGNHSSTSPDSVLMSKQMLNALLSN